MNLVALPSLTSLYLLVGAISARVATFLDAYCLVPCEERSQSSVDLPTGIELR